MMRVLKGDTIGIFTPSYPGNIILNEKYLRGVAFLSKYFKIVEGNQTISSIHQNYRVSSASDRANEFMDLYKNSNIKMLIATIGGSCTGSILPFLDYDFIRHHPKLICGYSDITALHCAINSICNMPTIYGPAVIPSFGEFPSPLKYTTKSFFELIGINTNKTKQEYVPPKKYSNHFIDATQKDWKSIKRIYSKNKGWHPIRFGYTNSTTVAYNLNTLISLAGTKYFPDLNKKLLILEQMNSNYALEERQLNQLGMIGVFESISGLIVSKPENFPEFNLNDYSNLINEFVKPNIPIVINFDTGHTHPMLCILNLGTYSLLSSENKVTFIKMC